MYRVHAPHHLHNTHTQGCHTRSMHTQHAHARVPHARVPYAPATSAGLYLFSVLPMPSWPALFKPQHLTPPPVTIAHVLISPEAMATAEIPEKGEGSIPYDQLQFRLLTIN